MPLLYNSRPAAPMWKTSTQSRHCTHAYIPGHSPRRTRCNEGEGGKRGGSSQPGRCNHPVHRPPCLQDGRQCTVDEEEGPRARGTRRTMSARNRGSRRESGCTCRRRREKRCCSSGRPALAQGTPGHPQRRWRNLGCCRDARACWRTVGGFPLVAPRMSPALTYMLICGASVYLCRTNPSGNRHLLDLSLHCCLLAAAQNGADVRNVPGVRSVFVTRIYRNSTEITVTSSSNSVLQTRSGRLIIDLDPTFS